MTISFRHSNFRRALKNLFSPQSNEKIVIEPNLGLGDSIIALALMRELSRKNPETKFYYCCLNYCYHSVTWMLKDLKNVYVFAIESGREARQLSGFLRAGYLMIGVADVDLKRFDAYFYDQHQIPFEQRWLDCEVSPGPQSDALYEALNPTREPYLLVCNQESTNIFYDLRINNPENKKIIWVRPETNNIFDWMKLALQADEIHSIDTSFVHFMESLFHQEDYRQLTKPFYYHLARKSNTEFTRRLPWKVIYY
jgi:hypothetical protein